MASQRLDKLTASMINLCTVPSQQQLTHLALKHSTQNDTWTPLISGETVFIPFIIAAILFYSNLLRLGCYCFYTLIFYIKTVADKCLLVPNLGIGTPTSDRKKGIFTTKGNTSNIQIMIYRSLCWIGCNQYIQYIYCDWWHVHIASFLNFYFDG